MKPFNLTKITTEIQKSFTLSTFISQISELENPYTNDHALAIEFNLKTMYIISITDEFVYSLIELQILSFLKHLSYDYNWKFKTIIKNGIIIF